jgi:hypothetical protein
LWKSRPKIFFSSFGLQEQLCNIAGKLCEWCPSEGSILALGAVDKESELGEIYLLDCRNAGVSKLAYKVKK